VNPAGVLCVSDTMLLTSTLASFWMWFQPVPAVPAPVIAAPPPAVRVAAAPTAAEVIKSVQAFYANIKQVTAMFRQEVTSTTFGDAKTSDGKVWISKPGKMRWDYYSKPKKGKVVTKKSFISNGDYLYVVEHDNKQVIKKNLSKDLMPVAVSFLYGKGDLATDFTGEIDKSGKYGGKDDLVLGLTPKTPSAQYKKLFLVVDPGNFRVKQSIIVDSADNVNHFRFFTPDFDKAVEAKWFEFDPKTVPSYRMVDADAQAAAPAAPAAGSGAGSGSAAKATAPAPAPTKTK
jgi:outer membrane lipoprotein carrier protein